MLKVFLHFTLNVVKYFEEIKLTMKGYILDKDRVIKILDILKKTYPDAKCELIHRDTFELLTSTILSAQTTDKRVNIVTEKLYVNYNNPYKMIELSQEELEGYIREIGLYRNKAKNILSMCRKLLDEYNGEVPNNMEDLIKLPGVGRKTANVVLSNAFGIPSIAVDTHVFRVSNRIGLANSDNVVKTEEQIKENIPMEEWSLSHHLLIFHGRRTCSARSPKCDICSVREYCDYNLQLRVESDS